MTYQWFKDGSAIAGATSAILLLPNLTIANSGDYSVVVSNDFGTVTSELAYVLVQDLGPPRVAIQSFVGVSISGIVGRTYALQFTTSLLPVNNWTTLTQVVLTNAAQPWIDYDSPNSGRRFYRAVLVP